MLYIIGSVVIGVTILGLACMKAASTSDDIIDHN